MGPTRTTARRFITWSAYALIATAAVCALILLWPLLLPTDTVTRQTYNRIDIGMSLKDVEELLGPGVKLGPLNFEEVHSVESRDLVLGTLPHRNLHWQSESHNISVLLDRQLRVVAKYYEHAPDVPLLQRVRDWIGL
jgi:hypothetical protein